MCYNDHYIVMKIQILFYIRTEQVLKGDVKMSINDMEKMKKFLEEKKAKAAFLQSEKKIGSGKVEKKNKNIGIESTRTFKI